MAASDSRPRWLKALVLIVLCASGFVLAAALHGAGSVSASSLTSAAWLKLGAIFASLGALFGVVLALDARSGVSIADARWLRVALCAVAGGSVVFAFSFALSAHVGFSWYATGAACGAALGWFGWQWARFVDF
jgi:hypothetical protein